MGLRAGVTVCNVLVPKDSDEVGSRPRLYSRFFNKSSSKSVFVGVGIGTRGVIGVFSRSPRPRSDMKLLNRFIPSVVVTIGWIADNPGCTGISDKGETSNFEPEIDKLKTLSGSPERRLLGSGARGL